MLLVLLLHWKDGCLNGVTNFNLKKAQSGACLANFSAPSLSLSLFLTHSPSPLSLSPSFSCSLTHAHTFSFSFSFSNSLSFSCMLKQDIHVMVPRDHNPLTIRIKKLLAGVSLSLSLYLTLSLSILFKQSHVHTHIRSVYLSLARFRLSAAWYLLRSLLKTKKVIESNPHLFQVVFLKLNKGPAALTNSLFISFEPK